MKTRKKLFVICLALVLTIASFMPSTFSWYNHSGTLTGNKLSYTRNDLPISVGSISMSTKRYEMSSSDAYRIFYDEKGNKRYFGSEIPQNEEVSVAGNSAQYFGTSITNNSSSPVYINLYLKGLANRTDISVGTIAPSLTQKGLSSSVHLANKNIVRIYMQWASAKGWKDSGAKHYVVYTSNDGTETAGLVDETNQVISVTDDNTDLINGTVTYYFDLPAGVKEFYLATDANSSKFDASTRVAKQKWYKTKSISEIHAETCYYLTGSVDDTTWNAQYSTFNIPGGVSVMTAFDTATLNVGQHAYVTLAKGTNYTGESVSYALTSGSNISVNDAGYVSASSSFGTGSQAQITTTVTGVLGDTLGIVTTVSNPPTVSVPVAMNVRISGGETYEIVWYIRNDGNTACSFGDSIKNIYYSE